MLAYLTPINMQPPLWNCTKKENKVNTREKRREEVLPKYNPNNFSKEELIARQFNAFKNFQSLHIRYGENYGLFYGLREDIFDPATLKCLKTYAKVYFTKMKEDTMQGKREAIKTSEFDYKMYNKFYKKVLSQIEVEQKRLKKQCKKGNRALVSRCVENNLKVEREHAQQTSLSA